MHAQKAELVPVAALKRDLVLNDVEEAATPETKGIAPLQNRPFAVLKDVLNDAYHLRCGEFCREHLLNCRATHYRSLCHLVIGGIFAIHSSERRHVGAIKGFDPGLDQLPRLHEGSNVRGHARWS
jgi:hypothetical protein